MNSKTNKFLIALPLLIGLLGCEAQQSVSPPAPTPAPQETVSPPAASPSPTPAPAETVSFQVEEFSFDELSNSGCGMTLWSPDQDSRDRYLFFNGLQSPMEMKIDGEIVQFDRTAASGEEFYGQQTSQTFQSQDGEFTVEVEVELGAPGEIESVAIDTGTLQVSQDGQTITIPVVGDAGC